MKESSIEMNNAKKMLADMISIIKGRKLSELSYEDGDIKIELKSACYAEHFKKEVKDIAGSKKASKKEEIYTINSHIVGVFHPLVNEGEETSVKVNDVIEKDQIIGFVESMGLSHEVKSKFDGEIVEILVDEGSPVEYGQPLIKIREMK